MLQLTTNVRRRAAITFAVLACLCAPAHAQDVTELLKYIPDSANALVVMDAKTLFESPLGKREKWSETYSDVLTSAPLHLPPTATRMVIGSEMNFQYMTQNWEVAVIQTGVDYSAKEIAQALRGAVDEIEKKSAVHTPMDAYVVNLAPRVLGVHWPGNRQAVSRWIRSTGQADSRGLSVYLSKFGFAADGAPLRMALELRDLTSRQEIRAGLAQCATLRGKSVNLDQMAAILSTIQGVRLSVDVDEKMSAVFSVDFEANPALLGDVAKPLLLEVLGHQGALVPEMAQWEAVVEKNAVTFRGDLSSSGLRRLFSDFGSTSVPASQGLAQGAQAGSVPETPVGTPPENPQGSSGRFEDKLVRVDSSQRYFKTISSYLSELQSEAQAASFDQIALWINNYATRIERLPPMAVDPELVAYGKSMSTSLRQILQVMNNANQQSLSAQSGLRPNVTRTYGSLPTWRTVNYGGYRMRRYAPFAYNTVNTSQMEAQRSQIQAQARAKVQAEAKVIVDKMTKETQAVRDRMTKKHGVAF